MIQHYISVRCFDINVNTQNKQMLNQVVSIDRKCLKCAHSTLNTATYYKELIFFDWKIGGTSSIYGSTEE